MGWSFTQLCESWQKYQDHMMQGNQQPPPPSLIPSVHHSSNPSNGQTQLSQREYCQIAQPLVKSDLEPVEDQDNKAEASSAKPQLSREPPGLILASEVPGAAALAASSSVPVQFSDVVSGLPPTSFVDPSHSVTDSDRNVQPTPVTQGAYTRNPESVNNYVHMNSKPVDTHIVQSEPKLNAISEGTKCITDAIEFSSDKSPVTSGPRTNSFIDSTSPVDKGSKSSSSIKLSVDSKSTEVDVGSLGGMMDMKLIERLKKNECIGIPLCGCLGECKFSKYLSVLFMPYCFHLIDCKSVTANISVNNNYILQLKFQMNPRKVLIIHIWELVPL